ncbi:glycosyltransferase [Paenibacillus sp. Soil787]|uniref:glycosyltransferase n=1 Tax=Paenibacillus sp. Soil787 TaxID=1736411 RepID=UPI0006F45EA8|nr:glycosyltransferase [Paenibacillus sp. Soil787]KRF35874.1 glycosyl transferase family 1 [Paenibacillus sp. Soil787]
MKILHVTLGLPPYRTGGLTKYSYDLMLSQIELNHDVNLMYPGHYNTGKVAITQRKSHQGIQIFEIINPLPVPLLGGVKQPNQFTKAIDKTVYINFLNELKPDVIHFHTLMGVHKEILEATRELNIKTSFTTHDYYGICPKVNLIDTTGKICNDYEAGNKCTTCNINGYSMLKIFIMQSELYRTFKDSSIVKKLRKNEKKKYLNRSENEIYNEKENIQEMAKEYSNLREYYMEMFKQVDVFHFNSSIAKQEFDKYFETPGKIIPIAHRDIHDARGHKTYDQQKPLNIGYLGPIDQYKGFYFLEEVLKDIDNSNWHLHIHGDNKSDSEEYDSSLFTFYGKYNHSKLKEIFNQIDVLVIPSIWKETFGFIGLEALSFGVPIVVSEYVGCQDIIENGETGIIFKANKDELKSLLLTIINDRNILRQINENILNMNFDYEMKKHAKEIIELYQYSS